jgi:hypothetical protein
MNYSIEVTQYIVTQYQNEPTRETVHRLAKELEKSDKSITGKLSKEGVYRRLQYTTKRGEKPVTKIEITSTITRLVNANPGELEGLEKSPKEVLKTLEKHLRHTLESVESE